MASSYIGPDTLASSNHCQTTITAGKVASAAEERKACQYAMLGQAYCFVPVAIETLGAFGPKTLSFMKELGRRIMVKTGDKRALQPFASAPVCGNATLPLGTCALTLLEHFLFVDILSFILLM